MMPTSGCRRWVVAALAAAATVTTPVRADNLIARITHDDVLRLLVAGESIVFVDAREADEWAEERLPGAVQLPLREIVGDRLQSVPKDATLVAYCIKDFRGFEVARALQRSGYRVRVLEDPGLQGWKKAKLPTAGDLAKRGDAEAALALQHRARR